MAECACGCGTEIPDHRRWVRGHHWRAKREAEGVFDTKVCSQCGNTYSRGQLQSRQSNVHWKARQFCSEECRRAAITKYEADAPTKQCPRCGIVKPRESFHADRWTRDGLQGACIECKNAMRKPVPSDVQRARNLRTFYGITVEDFDRMLEEQGGVCAICRQEETAADRRTGIKRLSVDHCHETGEVRGLLCRACNNGIGQLRHDVRLLQAAIGYLGR